jgi:hypothetical protein
MSHVTLKTADRVKGMGSYVWVLIPAGQDETNMRTEIVNKPTISL